VDLLPKTKVFVDSNILMYALSKNSVYHQDCKQFISRIADGEIFGFLNPFVMSEVLFKNVIASVIKEYHPKDLIHFIKRHPHVLKERKPIYKKTLRLLDLSLTMLSTDREICMKAVTLSTEYALLPNDAIHAATCSVHNIEHVATNDSDFERVSFLNIWKPEKAEESEE
jgi:predicted nucleic acid-binding protein